MSTHLVSGRAPREFAALREILPLLISIALIAAGSALLTTKTSLDLALQHLSVEAMRVVLTGYPGGFLLGCLFARTLIVGIGHGRTFQLMAVLMASATLLFMVSSDVWLWGGLRVVNGFAMASMFTVAESWINLYSGPRNRGSLLALYMIMSTLGVASGQSMINLGTPGDHRLFVLAAATCLMAALPFVLAGRIHPARRMPSAERLSEVEELISLPRLLCIVPVVVLAALQAGMSNMNFGVVAPIYASYTGHPASVAAALLTVYSLGGFLVQVPIGWLSDRIDRRFILAGAALISASSCLATALFGHQSVMLLFALFFVYGAAGGAIYPVAIAHAGQKFDSRYIVAISGRLLLVYAVGALIAPAVSNELMVRVQPSALFLFLGSASLVVSLACMLDIAFSRREATL